MYQSIRKKNCSSQLVFFSVRNKMSKRKNNKMRCPFCTVYVNQLIERTLFEIWLKYYLVKSITQLNVKMMIYEPMSYTFSAIKTDIKHIMKASKTPVAFREKKQLKNKLFGTPLGLSQDFFNLTCIFTFPNPTENFW